MATPFLCLYFGLWEVDFMTLQRKLDKHYNKLIRQHECKERKQKKRITREINRILFWNKIRKALGNLK